MATINRLHHLVTRLPDGPYRIYVVAAFLGVLSLLPILLRHEPSALSNVVALTSGVTFAVGFASWIRLPLRKLWASFAGKLVLALLHSLVLLLSIVPALPPKATADGL
jgi:hypothetical protein